jgi:hypothetical protein
MRVAGMVAPWLEVWRCEARLLYCYSIAIRGAVSACWGSGRLSTEYRAEPGCFEDVRLQ